VTAQSFSETLKHASGPLLSEISLFDVYEGDKIPSEKKSLGFRFHFLSAERTLQDSEVHSATENIIRAAQEKFQALLRS